MYRSLSQIADSIDQMEQSTKQTVDNVEAFAVQMRDSLASYPTPIISDEALEYWANFYEKFDIEKTGLRFILFLQNPMLYTQIVLR